MSPSSTVYGGQYDSCSILFLEVPCDVRVAIACGIHGADKNWDDKLEPARIYTSGQRKLRGSSCNRGESSTGHGALGTAERGCSGGTEEEHHHHYSIIHCNAINDIGLLLPGVPFCYCRDDTKHQVYPLCAVTIPAYLLNLSRPAPPRQRSIGHRRLLT